MYQSNIVSNYQLAIAQLLNTKSEISVRKFSQIQNLDTNQKIRYDSENSDERSLGAGKAKSMK